MVAITSGWAAPETTARFRFRSRHMATACAAAQTPTNAFGFLLYGAAACAYHSAGLSEAAATYDRLAEEELQRALLSLQAVFVPDEPHPVSIRWNC